MNLCVLMCDKEKKEERKKKKKKRKEGEREQRKGKKKRERADREREREYCTYAKNLGIKKGEGINIDICLLTLFPIPYLHPT